MSEASSNPDSTSRREWMSVLARMTVAELESVLDGVQPRPEYVLPRPAEAGLCMVRGRTGGTGRRFNLGEATVSRCIVALDDETTGVAYVLGRELRKAELAALVDALLQSGRLNTTVLDRAWSALEDRRRARADAVAATKVDFFTLVRGGD